ncbi:signal peptide, CUB and EGF-like domain-containing protein 2 [Tachypleus tridentatus]|uniref:signal peptide, CUB and EGF-like domain-containing protein 2 n=1 Tax=Tachypleus tridentatus TaxID=6853 RepID=UPI003FD491FE
MFSYVLLTLLDPCPPGHYDNGFQTHCLPCPGGTYMTSFGADACVACPDDEITDEEGADNKDLCRNPTDMVLKVTFPWATKPTVVRYPWWMEELTLISICLIAL